MGTVSTAAEAASLTGLKFVHVPVSNGSFSAVPAGYKPMLRILAALEVYALRFPAQAKLVDLTEMFNRGRKTAEGRSIFGLKISDNVDTMEDEPNVLVVAAHHCREIITPEVALGTVQWLLEGGGAAGAAAVKGYQTWVIPVLNVDGYHFVFEEEPLWRKNRRPLSSGAVGVDLNRNYPQGWGARQLRHRFGNHLSRIYRLYCRPPPAHGRVLCSASCPCLFVGC